MLWGYIQFQWEFGNPPHGSHPCWGKEGVLQFESPHDFPQYVGVYLIVLFKICAQLTRFLGGFGLERVLGFSTPQDFLILVTTCGGRKS